LWSSFLNITFRKKLFFFLFISWCIKFDAWFKLKIMLHFFRVIIFFTLTAFHLSHTCYCCLLWCIYLIWFRSHVFRMQNFLILLRRPSLALNLPTYQKIIFHSIIYVCFFLSNFINTLIYALINYILNRLSCKFTEYRPIIPRIWMIWTLMTH